MIELFKKLLGKTSDSSASEVNRERKLKIATCVILLEAATADANLSPDEKRRIISILRERFEMTESAVKELMETSKKERQDATDLWHFTSHINETLDKGEKYELMEMIWRVIYTDGRLDKFENSIAHKLQTLLRLDHSKFIEIKLRVKNSIQEA